MTNPKFLLDPRSISNNNTDNNICLSRHGDARLSHSRGDEKADERGQEAKQERERGPVAAAASAAASSPVDASPGPGAGAAAAAATAAATAAAAAAAAAATTATAAEGPDDERRLQPEHRGGGERQRARESDPQDSVLQAGEHARVLEQERRADVGRVRAGVRDRGLEPRPPGAGESSVLGHEQPDQLVGGEDGGRELSRRDREEHQREVPRGADGVGRRDGRVPAGRGGAVAAADHDGPEPVQEGQIHAAAAGERAAGPGPGPGEAAEPGGEQTEAGHGRQRNQAEAGQVQELRQGQPGRGCARCSKGRDERASRGQLLRGAALHPRVQSQGTASDEAEEEVSFLFPFPSTINCIYIYSCDIRECLILQGPEAIGR